MFVNINDVKALGLAAAQGVVATEAWYWDRDDDSRAFARRFAERHRGAMPTQYQAGIYSAVRHYLKAIEAAGTDEAWRWRRGCARCRWTTCSPAAAGCGRMAGMCTTCISWR